MADLSDSEITRLAELRVALCDLMDDLEAIEDDAKRRIQIERDRVAAARDAVQVVRAQIREIRRGQRELPLSVAPVGGAS